MKKFRLWMGVTTKLVMGMAVLAGCTKPNEKSCKGDNHCNDPALPFCDVDGAISGEPGTCVAPEGCTPGTFETCRGDQAIVCNADATNYDVVQCENGCSVEGSGCRACPEGMETCTPTTHIVPKFLPSICDALASSPNLTVSTTLALDVDDDATCNGGVVAQASGPSICVVRHGTITITADAVLQPTGTRALALVADDLLTVAGELSVGAALYTVEVPGAHGPSQQPVAVHPDGNGGGGFKSAGGPGGTANADGAAANGGPPMTSPGITGVLIGGASGGGAFGGTGGGALTLISCRGSVSVLGLIDANGGGGGRGQLDPNGVRAAAGGGSGGYVALQGRSVNVTGQLFANGGGGGGGFGTNDFFGARGTRSATQPAPGGGTGGAGVGGDGAIGSVAAGPGRKPIEIGAGAGAGGGSVGMLETFTPLDSTPLLQPSAVSPAFEPNKSLELR